MNPRFLRTFLHVANCRSFTRAARELHLAQSSVSDQMQCLEDELGTALFLRSRQGLQLTAAGEALVAPAQQVLAALDAARDGVALARRSLEQHVTIGALETIASELLPSPLASLRREHPELRLRVEVAGSADLLQRLRDGRIDVAFCFRRGALDGQLLRRVYATEPLILIGPPATEDAAALPHPGALATMPFVATEPGCVYRHLFDEAWRQAGSEPPRPVAELGSIGAIVRLVEAGSGYALVPRLAASRKLESGALTQHRWPRHETVATLDMIWRRRRVQPPGLALFLALMSDARNSLKRGGVRPPRAAPCPS
ncbi:LysR family transcriptional regulator [Mangrovibrevibacter kandeliae]|uniref:LysR family transcriptional regulator n=1 Tax=Mangrovibrevibacter kandeliae TaxID=2968473 RepID=UPI00211932FB|nr:LysR family transcriptional regulator [Aurantimonas sp. CSK15Z-1]MCQ8781370.1 LysR family transcriptional regulator [Aurantimonas sp. CSK15Z-1]